MPPPPPKTRICPAPPQSGQVVGDVTYPFDDAEQASVAVAALEEALAMRATLDRLGGGSLRSAATQPARPTCNPG